MSDELEKVPPIVQQLADEVGKRPWSWFIADDHVSIVFIDGVKLRFDRPGAIKSGPKPQPVVKSETRSKPPLVVTKLGELSRRPRRTKK
jgi:hypothetical protein